MTGGAQKEVTKDKKLKKVKAAKKPKGRVYNVSLTVPDADGMLQEIRYRPNMERKTWSPYRREDRQPVKGNRLKAP